MCLLLKQSKDRQGSSMKTEGYKGDTQQRGVNSKRGHTCLVTCLRVLTLLLMGAHRYCGRCLAEVAASCRADM